MTYARVCRRCKPLVVSALDVFFVKQKENVFFVILLLTFSLIVLYCLQL